MKLYRYIEVSLYRDSRYNDIAVKSPKISLYRGKIKMYFFTAYYAVAIKRMEGKTKAQASHCRPRTTDTVTNPFHLFLKHGGQISIKVTGKRRNKGIGLEIPATYMFGHKKESKIIKLSELLNDNEDIKRGIVH